MTDEVRAETAPVAARPGAEPRHELVTPINQTIGDGETLEEEAGVSQRVERLRNGRTVFGPGRDVSLPMKHIVPATGAACPADLPHLRLRRDILLARIVENCEALGKNVRNPLDGTRFADLAKVTGTVGRLAEIVERRLGGTELDAGRSMD